MNASYLLSRISSNTIITNAISESSNISKAYIVSKSLLNRNIRSILLSSRLLISDTGSYLFLQLGSSSIFYRTIIIIEGTGSIK